MKLIAEIRDWLETVATAISLYLAWRWRPRRQRRDVTVRPPAATMKFDAPRPALIPLNPSHGVGGGSLVLTTGNDAGTQAVLNSMAETDPDFPQF
jgi:hypothetical protein